MRKFKYISNIEEDELKENFVISCVNENLMPCILIKNAELKTIVTQFSTDNLEVKLNSVLVLHDNEYYFHIITSKRNDDFANKQFEIVFDYIFNKLDHPVDEDGLNQLFGSIEEFFRITPISENRTIQIGLFGELLTVKKLYDAGYREIIEKYHKDFFMKHDVEINAAIRLEIKTTTSSLRVHNFRHDQIRRHDTYVYVSSVLLEESQEGLSLYDLCNQIINITNQPDIIFSIYKTMKWLGINEENQGLRFSEKLALNNITFFDARKLPQINIDTIQGVSDIAYKVDCSFTESVTLEEIIQIFKC